MAMTNVLGLDLFQWWVACISGGSVFLTVVSIYLYRNSSPRHESSSQPKARLRRFSEEFIFVWVLLSLLGFYIVTIHLQSAEIFAAGNILVEAMLLIYVLKNKKRKSEET